MVSQLGLFYAPYPASPGWKRTETSRAAAIAIKSKAAQLKERIFALLKREALTADEVASRLHEEKHNVRSRISELSAENPPRAFDTGQTHENVSGRQAIVWGAA